MRKGITEKDLKEMGVSWEDIEAMKLPSMNKRNQRRENERKIRKTEPIPNSIWFK